MTYCSYWLMLHDIAPKYTGLNEQSAFVSVAQGFIQKQLGWAVLTQGPSLGGRQLSVWSEGLTGAGGTASGCEDSLRAPAVWQGPARGWGVSVLFAFSVFCSASCSLSSSLLTFVYPSKNPKHCFRKIK